MRFRIFISSLQKEFAEERRMLASICGIIKRSTDRKAR